MSEFLMTAKAFATKAKEIAASKTLYVMGGFGAPLTPSAKARYTGPNANAYNRQPSRTALINAASNDTFAFDCVGVLKAILWGWCGKLDSVYGGATYASNGVPDINADQMIERCLEVSTDFSLDKLTVGEAVWKSGHIGVYVGDGLAVECTPAWLDCAQITACNRSIAGYNTRTWVKHGKLPWIDYSAEKPQPDPEPAPEPDMPFVDVPAKAYYRDAVKWAYENGITTGIDTTHFGPNKSVTRAMLVQMIYKLFKLIIKTVKNLLKAA